MNENFVFTKLKVCSVILWVGLLIILCVCVFFFITILAYQKVDYFCKFSLFGLELLLY